MTNSTEILSSALEHRDAEILSYQININNFTLAIAKIEANYPDDPDLSGPFKADLQQRLEAEIIQHRRAIVIRDVIADQLNAMEATEP